jgi:hypothetical protein
MILGAVLEVASRWSEPAALSFELQVPSFKFQVRSRSSEFNLQVVLSREGQAKA